MLCVDDDVGIGAIAPWRCKWFIIDIHVIKEHIMCTREHEIDRKQNLLVV